MKTFIPSSQPISFIMDSEESTRASSPILDSFDSSLASFYIPFFPQSVNLISANTNAGKTHFILQVLKNKDRCFYRPVSRALIVLCNEKVNDQDYRDLSDETLHIDTCYLDEFSINDYETDNLLLIFEDVSKLTKDILECINVNAHHLKLASIILVLQSVFADKEFKVLLGLVHRVIIYFSGSGGTQLGQYIRKYYFVSSDIKDNLKQIISYAENNRTTVILQVNEVARKEKSHYFALAGIENFLSDNIDTKPAIVFPLFYNRNMYEEEFDDNTALVDFDPSILPRGSYVLVKAENVFKKSQKKTSPEDQCTIDLNSTGQAIVNNIESALKYNKRQPAINLAKSILTSKYFCVTKDGNKMWIKDQPKTATSVLDYINAAVRAAGPKEIADPKYVSMTKYLLKNTPLFYFKNKSLLPGNNAAARRAQNKQRRQMAKIAKAKKQTKKYKPLFKTADNYDDDYDDDNNDQDDYDDLNELVMKPKHRK